MVLTNTLRKKLNKETLKVMSFAYYKKDTQNTEIQELERWKGPRDYEYRK